MRSMRSSSGSSSSWFTQSDSKHDIETLNLLVQRNIPVTFAKPAAEIINETIDPEGEEPKILKAMPVRPLSKAETAAAVQKEKARAPEKTRKALPVEHGRKN